MTQPPVQPPSGSTPEKLPARQGIMTETVTRDKIMSAVSINQTIGNVLQFAGHGGAGFLIGWKGVQYTYMTMACFCILSILSLIPMKYERRNTSLKKNLGSFPDNIKDGLKYVSRTPDVRAVLGLTLVAGAFALCPTISCCPPSAMSSCTPRRRSWASCPASRALSGSRCCGRPGLLLIRTVFVTGCILVVLCLSQSYYFSVSFVYFLGIAQAIRQNMASTLIQTYTEDAYLVRVLSVNFTQNGLFHLVGFGVAVPGGGHRFALRRVDHVRAHDLRRRLLVDLLAPPAPPGLATGRRSRRPRLRCAPAPGTKPSASIDVYAS